jgi:hypothetical protein
MGKTERERRKRERLEKQRARAERDREVKQTVQPEIVREPKSIDISEPQREPVSIEVSSPSKIKVQWCFELFDAVTDWRINVGAEDHASFISVADHLKAYSRLTWGDIQSRKDRDHPIPIEKLCDRARARLIELQRDDADELWRLRFSGTQRLWGVKVGHVLRLIWWDPDHQVCPCPKKNT